VKIAQQFPCIAMWAKLTVHATKIATLFPFVVPCKAQILDHRSTYAPQGDFLMASNYKQQAMAEFFAADIKRRTSVVTTAAVTVSVSGTVASPTAGDNVVVTLNAGDATSAGSGVVVFRGQRGVTSATDPGFSDLPGFSGSGKQPIYTTGVATYITELPATGQENPAAAALPFVLADLSRRGLKVEWYTCGNGTAPNSINIDTLATCTLQGIYEPNVDWSISGRV
jgi:hypothetical protein